MPLLASPMALTMPEGVSVRRGGGLPVRGSSGDRLGNVGGERERLRAPPREPLRDLEGVEGPGGIDQRMRQLERAEPHARSYRGRSRQSPLGRQREDRPVDADAPVAGGGGDDAALAGARCRRPCAPRATRSLEAPAPAPRRWTAASIGVGPQAETTVVAGDAESGERHRRRCRDARRSRRRWRPRAVRCRRRPREPRLARVAKAERGRHRRRPARARRRRGTAAARRRCRRRGRAPGRRASGKPLPSGPAMSDAVGDRSARRARAAVALRLDEQTARRRRRPSGSRSVGAGGSRARARATMTNCPGAGTQRRPAARRS